MIVDNGAARRIKGPRLYNREGDRDIYVIDLGLADALAHVTEYTYDDGPTYEVYDLGGVILSDATVEACESYLEINGASLIAEQLQEQLDAIYEESKDDWMIP